MNLKGRKTETELKKMLISVLKEQLDNGSWEKEVKEFIKYLKNGAEFNSKLLTLQQELKTFLDQNDREKLKQFMKLFTCEVVYDVASLALICGLKKCKYDDSQFSQFQQAEQVSLIEHALNIHEVFDDETVMVVKNCIIFNARKRQFQFVRGITNTDLVTIITHQKFKSEPLAIIKNAFSMLKKDGGLPDGPDLHSYRGKFDPEFYPIEV